MRLIIPIADADNYESFLLAYCVLLSLKSSLMGAPTKPNSFAIAFLKKCSKLSVTKFFRLTKRKKVGGLVLIYIKYRILSILPPSVGILCTF